MADDEIGRLTGMVGRIGERIAADGADGFSRAALDVAFLHRFAAWNALLACEEHDGMPSLVFGWAQWEAMGRFPVSGASPIRLLSPARRPTAARGGVRGFVPFPGDEGARWSRSGWIEVNAFDVDDTRGVDAALLFTAPRSPDRESVMLALAGMAELMGADPTYVAAGPDVAVVFPPGPRARIEFDPENADPASLAHLVAHMASDGAGDDATWLAGLLTVMLCGVFGVRSGFPVTPPPGHASPVDALERARILLARLLLAAPGRPTVTSGRGSSRLSRPPRGTKGRPLPGSAGFAGLRRLSHGAPLVVADRCPACGGVS